MILLYENKMVSIPEDAIWSLCVKQIGADRRWCLVLQVDDEIVDEILDSEEYIDKEEKDALEDVLEMFSGVICVSTYAMVRGNNDDVCDLGSVIRREIAEWMDDKKYG